MSKIAEQNLENQQINIYNEDLILIKNNVNDYRNELNKAFKIEIGCDEWCKHLSNERLMVYKGLSIGDVVYSEMNFG